MRDQLLAILILAIIGCSSTPPAKMPPGITPPIPIHKVDPQYPAELRKDRVTGIVTIEAFIDKTGKIQNVTVLRSADQRLNEYALEAVRMWRFKPGTVNGEPVDVIFQLDIAFSIP